MSKVELKYESPHEFEIEPEIVTLTDGEVEIEVRKYLETHGYKRIIEIVRHIREDMIRRGYVVSEDRIRRILREIMGIEYYQYNY